jgi:hypothetical protein
MPSFKEEFVKEFNKNSKIENYDVDMELFFPYLAVKIMDINT